METQGRDSSSHVVGALTALIVALLLVGVVSHLLLRHVVQVIPAVLALIFAICGGRAARYAALPVFLCWLFLMTLIWLFLLGLTRVISGHFTTTETLLTIVIGAASLWGLVLVLRFRALLLPAIIYFIAFAALQWIFLRLSFLPAIAQR
ncbi:MAG TPA: hypothetical protein VH024_11965 [Candidatus Angelobacter sp.]|jgi:hypothetical protein|nr:hypothetical protein [Candidatus Angelobacter sp.]